MSSPEGSGKHAHRAEPSRPRRPATVTHGNAGARLAAALVVLGVLVALLIWSPWSSEPDSAATPGSGGRLLPTYGADWKTAAGDSYRITVTPAVVVTDRASEGGCFPEPEAGSVNVRFDVRIENLSHDAEPVPEVEVGVNTDADGHVRPQVLDYPHTSRSVELAPRVDGESCSEAASLGPDGRKTLPGGTGRTWKGTVGAVDRGPGTSPSGLRLIVRYREVDATARGGSSPADIVVPFAFEPVPAG